MQWVEEEQACVSSHVIEQELLSRRAQNFPAISTENNDIILEVNSGQKVLVSVGGEVFNVADIPAQLSEMKTAQDELKRTIADDFGKQIADLQTDMKQLKADIAADLSTSITANTAAIASNGALAKTNSEAAAANAALSKANAAQSQTNKASSNTNAGNIKTNSVDINTNTASIEGNKVQLAANTKLVAAHELHINPPCQDNIKWVRFQAGGTGNPKILGGYGIKEVVRLGKGQYNVVFKNAYPDNKFGVAMMCEEQGYPASNLRRVVASIGGSRGGDHSFGNMFFKDRMIVDTRRTQNPAVPMDHAVIVNFAVFREDKSNPTCGNFIKSTDWTSAIRYTTYRRIDNRNRNQVLVENGFEVQGPSSAGQWIGLKPRASSASGYSVASCASGASDGTYMGLEGFLQGGSYTQYGSDKFSQDTRRDQNGRPHTEGNIRIVSTVGFDTNTDKIDQRRMKLLTWRGGGLGNAYANIGVKAVRKIGPGTYRITWNIPFANSNYAVFGLANMWCSGGQMLHVEDSRVFKQTATETQVTTTYPYNNYIHSQGAEDSTGCAFMTLIAIGDYE